MAENSNQDFLGTGWSFPPTFSKAEQGVKMVSAEEDIQQSLEILLSTRPGERIMHPEYGCNLDIMLFEPLTTTLITYVSDMIRTSILYFEPRLDLLKVDINSQQATEGLILIEIDYIIRSTNSRFNYVYPFYLSDK